MTSTPWSSVFDKRAKKSPLTPPRPANNSRDSLSRTLFTGVTDEFHSHEIVAE